MFSASKTAICATIILAFFSNFSQTSAAPVAAAQATEMLARAQAVQQKCKFLNASQQETLSSFVAMAEIAMVSKSSTKAAKSIIADGRAQGQKATCSDTERTDILDIINAAQQATAAAKPPLASPVSVKQPAVTILAAKKSAPEPVQKRDPVGSLAQYAQLTKRYYLARRCNSMSANAINSLYRNVVATHRHVISNFGVPAVRTVMQQSEHHANQSSCG
jgi:hypothetical protein